ncbi:DNA translocase FtsK [Planctomycetales bacterium ZRK34]|nr:DNA translocase FtsK [Planctomycetales bacterium ZRK34]
MSRKRKTSDPIVYPSMTKRIMWVFLAGVTLMVIASLASFSPYDPPSHAAAPLNDPPINWVGRFGAAVAYQAYLMFGAGAWVCIAGLVAYLAATAAGRKVNQIEMRIIGTIIAAIASSGFLALLAPTSSPLPEGAGGLIALEFVNQLLPRFNTLGTLVLLMMCFGVGAMLAADNLMMALPRGIVAALRKIAAINWPKPVLVGMFRNMHWPALPTLGRRGSADKPGVREHDLDEAIATEDDEKPISRAKPPKPVKPEPVEEEEYEYEYEEEDDPETEAAADEYEEEEADEEESAKDPLDPEALREKIKKLPITFAKPKNSPAAAAPKPQDLSGYRFPGLEVLAEPESSFTSEMAKIVREQAEILERALQTFKIDAEVVAIDAGPVITLYEVQLAPGTKVSQINAISSDVARELKAQNIRIVPNTAGKSTVGIEVPNLKKEKVRLKELLALGGEDVFEKQRLPMFLGKDASGNALIADLASMPHMLIAGTTGSGKSICINSIIMSWLLGRKPDELKLVLVDPKMVEMAQFRDIPHLMCPVVTEMGKAAAILEWAVTKMEERYALLAEAAVRDIDSYNGLEWDDLKERMAVETPEEEAKIPRKLPRLVFIIDELADLILTHKEVEGFIVRIAQKARAVGIHLILATQRPQANVVTGLIKSNMPCRVSFKVASGMDSRIVLDAKGAELLLGQGDMLFLSPRTSKLMRAQGTLVDDGEVRKVVKFLKNVAEQAFEPQLVQLKAPGEIGGDDPTQRDELFDQAVDIVIETKRGSVSLLQRRLSIGYSRSSRLIEEMAAAGIIGEYKGSQAREVNITQEEWEAIKAQMQSEAAGLYAADQEDFTPASGGAAPGDASSAVEEEVEEEEYEYEEVEDPEAELEALAEDEEYEEEEEDDADEQKQLARMAEDYDEDESASDEEDEDDDEDYEEYEYVEEDDD